MQRPILVVGATGTVGSQVVAQLVAAGRHVRALARDPAKTKRLGNGIDTAIGDLEQPHSLPAAFAGVERAFVLAPPAPNLEQLEANAFAAADKAGVKHIVYLSNFGAGSFDDDLWQAHGANERRLRALTATWTILRPVRFMTNTPYGWASIHEQGRLVEPLGGRKATLIDPLDIAAVAVKALTESGHEGKTYELVGEALTGSEIAERLSLALGRPVAFIDGSEDEARDNLVRSGFPPPVAEKVLFYFRTMREGRWYETSTLRELLGRPPRTYAAWLKEHLPPTASGGHA
jgi:uncharacterized protein YbjT (DUF2867 family)